MVVQMSEISFSPAGVGADLPARTSEAWRGVVAALPMMLGFMPFAMVLGAQAAQKGMSALEISLMTGLNFAGGSEFAAVRLWTSPPHILLIATMTLLVNCRHILMSAALTPYLRGLSKRKACLLLFFMCDEIWAMSLDDAKRRVSSRISVGYYCGVSACLYLTWVAFTALGGALGPVLGDLEQYGLDMAFTAVFLVLLRGMWQGARASLPWLVSLVVAAVTYLLVPGAWYVAAGACAGLVAAVLLEKPQ